MTLLKNSLALLGLGLLALAGCNGPRPPEVVVVGGFGAIDLDGEGDFPDDPIIDTPRFSGRIGVGFEGHAADTDGYGSGPRLGGRFNFSYTRESFDDRSVAGEPFLEIEDYVDLSLFTPQVIVSYRQVFAGDADFGGWYVEPGVGVGPTIGTIGFGSTLEFGDSPVATDLDDTETEVGFGVNPFARIGYDTGSVLFGAEGGYLWTNLNFDDDLGRDPSEWYVGFHLGIKIGR